ncbi:MAG: ComEC/Rec2 family competence protein, partial [Prevotella sp.]|nr:ComEC/Rec2 family competence protein [Prevotella sp.]
GLTTVSLAAQLGTAPLVAYYFGQLPTYFLLSNYLIIPLTTLTLYLSLACIATCWWAALHHALVSGLIAVVGFMNQALRIIACLPKSSVEDIHLSTLQVCLVYVVIGCLWVVLMVYRKDVQHFTKV